MSNLDFLYSESGDEREDENENKETSRVQKSLHGGRNNQLGQEKTEDSDIRWIPVKSTSIPISQFRPRENKHENALMDYQYEEPTEIVKQPRGKRVRKYERTIIDHYQQKAQFWKKKAQDLEKMFKRADLLMKDYEEQPDYHDNGVREFDSNDPFGRYF